MDGSQERATEIRKSRCRFAYEPCTTQVPPLEFTGGSQDRLAACWKQQDGGPIPVELAAPEPAGQVSDPPEPVQQGSTA